MRIRFYQTIQDKIKIMKKALFVNLLATIFIGCEKEGESDMISNSDIFAQDLNLQRNSKREILRGHMSVILKASNHTF